MGREKKRTVGPRVSTPTRIGMGQQLVTAKQTTCHSEIGAGQMMSAVHSGKCGSAFSGYIFLTENCLLWAKFKYGTFVEILKYIYFLNSKQFC